MGNCCSNSNMDSKVNGLLEKMERLEEEMVRLKWANATPLAKKEAFPLEGMVFVS